MGWWYMGPLLRSVLVDVSTQRDFLDAEGALPVQNREALLPRLRRMMALARAARLPVISSVDTHRETDPLNGVPRHCIEGTTGQQKIPFTLLAQRIVVEADNTIDLPYCVLSRFRQVIFRKQDYDFFSNPKADRLLTELDAGEFVLFGVGLERSVKALALGLLARHKKVAVVIDACGYWSEADADLATRQLRAKGIRITTVDELASALRAPRTRDRARIGSPDRHHPLKRSHASKGTRTRTMSA